VIRIKRQTQINGCERQKARHKEQKAKEQEEKEKGKTQKAKIQKQEAKEQKSSSEPKWPFNCLINLPECKPNIEMDAAEG
jgi:hypothetical protein